MILRPLTEGTVAGTGTLTVKSRILGGVLISTNNTNAVTVVIRTNDSSGYQVFDLSTLSPGFHIAPIRLEGPDGSNVKATETLYYDISGTGGSAQLYEWVQ